MLGGGPSGAVVGTTVGAGAGGFVVTGFLPVVGVFGLVGGCWASVVVVGFKLVVGFGFGRGSEGSTVVLGPPSTGGVGFLASVVLVVGGRVELVLEVVVLGTVLEVVEVLEVVLVLVVLGTVLEVVELVVAGMVEEVVLEVVLLVVAGRVLEVVEVLEVVVGAVLEVVAGTSSSSSGWVVSGVTGASGVGAGASGASLSFWSTGW